VEVVAPRRRRNQSWIALAVAAVWSVGLLVGAATLPAYKRVSAAYSSTVAGPLATTESSATLVEENGAGVLAFVAIPLVISGAIALALWRRQRVGRPGAGPFAWTVCGILLIFCLLAMLTIGVFVVPVAVALVVGCALAS